MPFARIMPFLLLVAWTSSIVDAQRRPPARRAPAAPSATTPKPSTPASPTSSTPARPDAGVVREAPLMQCPSVLGNGIKTQRLFCDILTGSDPAGGLRVSIPAHDGPAILLFTLHNRQTRADEPAPAAQAFARYTATLRVVLPDGGLVRQTVVQTEFRGPADFVERISSGAGGGGVKPVAPTGSEPIALELPPSVTEVSLLGERLTIERLDGREEVTEPGQPIAVVSQVQVEYRPPPPPGTRRRP